MEIAERITQQGDRVTLTLTSWGRLGEAMADFDGYNVFVAGGIPGERVVAEVVKVHRKYVSAKVVDVLEASPDRVEPPCPYYGECTGCQWQHLSYDAQLKTKHEKVTDALQRVGELADPPVSEVRPSPDQLGYRNHARFTINRDGALGFINRETRQFVRIDKCLLMHQGVNDLLEELQDHCGETTQLSIRAGKYSGDFLIQPYLVHPEIGVLTGQKRYTESVAGQDFLVSSPSFFQVNVEQAAAAADVVRDRLHLTAADVLLDAYTGVGTFAILLAPSVKRVIAVEESSAAVADAKQNAGDLQNLEFVLGRTEDVLRNLPVKPDVVVLDPPRSGCQPRALESLIEMAPSRVAYVSCDAETLGRDLKILCQGGYRLDEVAPLDMFPQTHHVECVALLSRGESSSQPAPASLTLASASPRRRELMNLLGLEFTITPADLDEDSLPGESPVEMVERLSRQKALAVAAGMESGLVIGADSTVVFEVQAVGKPVDDDDARRMLRMLSGTTHHVSTGITVVDAASGQILSDAMTSQISLRYLTDQEIDASIASGVPRDKAGAYAVQDTDLRPAADWEGCYNNIVGLPICRLLEMLQELGYQLPDGWTVPDAVACGDDCPTVSAQLQKGSP
ncbi:MAG: 23S rRNA (uracil(1939)-C(5))-methyltransferase RlmD [SAR202 cluster bacterium]|nr:23S rRNA (uracil(1939)-C(5))-methyltransferase RlmD [Dehalococcoidia bacterium]MEE3003831.1 23S rRNA (uracil(1939)-C(5))-methyltransferase RlmD [Chloroflexota bacterium]MQG50040.1 23S rRNA (uracil(1939)-C(5))-methyltransferase RlmD [SAR202 cluster bacterium]|tara:strand:+ start:825 stop:2696 length:1872 start_codon:yes stop_codon:yes gene_type:complete